MRAKESRPMNDLKYAVRALLKSPVFAAIAVVTLALGIGLNIGMFSMLNSMFLQPLPFEKQEALVRVLRATPGNPDGDISAADYADLRSGETEFGEFAGSWDEAVSLALKGRTTMLEQALRVSTNYFDVLRVPAGAPRVGARVQPGRRRYRHAEGGDDQRRPVEIPVRRGARHRWPHRAGKRRRD